jgi:hypothetical protein
LSVVVVGLSKGEDIAAQFAVSRLHDETGVSVFKVGQEVFQLAVISFA